MEVPFAFTIKSSVAADSATAFTATLSVLEAEKLVVPNVNVPRLTAVGPVYVFGAPKANLPAPDLVKPAVPARIA
jgi:hypothetical protein